MGRRNDTKRFDRTEVADYVIVGLGTAGAPLARYLSEKSSVIVLEAGENRSDDPNVLEGAPLGADLEADPLYTFHRSADPSDVVTIEEVFVDTQGRMWGGSSAHNSLIAVRSSPDAYNAWAAASDNPVWSYDNLLPIMKFMETYTPRGTALNEEQRGTDGPLFITQDVPLPDNFYADMAAATNAPLTPDINDPSLPNGDVGTATLQWFSTPPLENTLRSWSISAFLPDDIVDADGYGRCGRQLRILSRATVAEIILEDGRNECGCHVTRAVGVRYYLNDRPEQVLVVRARKKVILCAGTIANPPILQRSGIGPREVLESLDLPVVLANDHVGRNMQQHYGPVGLIAEDPLNPPGFEPFFSDNFIDMSSLPGAPFTVANSPGQIRPNDGVRKMQTFTVPQPFFIPRAILNALEIDTEVPNISISGTLLADVTRTGTVEIVSIDPLTPPRIVLNLYKTQEEIDRAIGAYKIFANIAEEYGTTMLFPPAAQYPAPYGAAPDDSLLQQYVEDNTNIQHHNTGTCRMATSAAEGVVDGNLDVFGVEGLSCCDNSVIPEITRGNTAYPAYLIGLVKAKLEGADTPY